MDRKDAAQTLIQINFQNFRLRINRYTETRNNFRLIVRKKEVSLGDCNFFFLLSERSEFPGIMDAELRALLDYTC